MKGADEMLRRLKQLEIKMPNVAAKAVKEVADDFEQTLKKNTPVGPERKRRYSEGHLKDDTAQGPLRKTGGYASKDIGYGKTGWRAHFPDSGTIHQRAQNFTEKTISEMRPKALETYERYLKENLGGDK